MNRIGFRFFKKNIPEIVIVIFSISFSIWLMFLTFSYRDGSMIISGNLWSDFGSHIPLIRSFSLGDNFPPQYPLFSGPLIHYHFLFYFFAGMLEKSGIRIDYALNILSITGFSLLISTIYFFSKKIFHSRIVGFLSVLFFLFNGSLSFIYFIQKNPISRDFIGKIITNDTFPTFGPWDNKIVSAFWNLNIYTNQRHLGLSIALSLALIYFLILPIIENRKNNTKTNIFSGIVFGLCFLLNTAIFLMSSIILSFLFLLFSKLRRGIFITLAIAGIIALPQYLYIQSGNSSFRISFFPGYLIHENLNFMRFITYWFYNLGLHIFLIPLGFSVAPTKIKKLFLAFLSLFVVGNLFQFAPEVAANHKFFNYFMIIGVMFSSSSLLYLWRKNIFLKPVVLLLSFFLIFSGIIDFFPIINSHQFSLLDFSKNTSIDWIMKNTKKKDVFLNSNFLYDDASIAGRDIFLGWPYLSWSQGYDTNGRYKTMQKILGQNDFDTLCRLLQQNDIDYIEIIENRPDNPNYPKVSNIFEKRFNEVFRKDNAVIYQTRNNCRSI